MKEIISNEELTKAIENKEVVSIVCFSADWCAPCKMLKPNLIKLEESNQKVLVFKIDVDKSPEIANQYGISSIPSLFYYYQGEIKKKDLGVLSFSKLEETINHILNKKD